MYRDILFDIPIRWLGGLILSRSALSTPSPGLSAFAFNRMETINWMGRYLRIAERTPIICVELSGQKRLESGPGIAQHFFLNYPWGCTGLPTMSAIRLFMSDFLRTNSPTRPQRLKFPAEIKNSYSHDTKTCCNNVVYICSQ